MSEESLREIEAWEKFAKEYFAGLKSRQVKKTTENQCDDVVDNK